MMMTISLLSLKGRYLNWSIYKYALPYLKIFCVLMIFWTFQKSSASPSKPLALPTPIPSSPVEATSSKPVDDGTMLKGISSVPESSSQLMNEPPSSQGVYPPMTEAEGNSVFDVLPLFVLLVSDWLFFELRRYSHESARCGNVFSLGQGEILTNGRVIGGQLG
jgi:hypothetical protein